MSWSDLAALLPAGVSMSAALGLVATSFVTSALSAAAGIGGGVVLLAIMTQLIPIAALVPVHGVVQIGANFSRIVLQGRYAERRLVALLFVGFVIGAVAGGSLVVELPDRAIKAAIGAFLLWSVWGRLPPLRGSGNVLLIVGGSVASALTMFVGSTGPFVVAILRRFDLDRLTLVGTQAAAMFLQHVLKIAVFGLLGFAFAQWLPLLAGMIAVGFLGSVAGHRLLHRLPEAHFRTGLNLILTLIAAELLLESLIGWFG